MSTSIALVDCGYNGIEALNHKRYGVKRYRRRAFSIPLTGIEVCGKWVRGVLFWGSRGGGGGIIIIYYDELKMVIYFGAVLGFGVWEHRRSTYQR